MSELPDHKSWLRARIHDTRTLLMEITTPKTPSQEIAHGEYIRRLDVLTLDANTDLLDTKAIYGNDIDGMEFEDFKASIHNIERETSAVYNGLRTQETHNIKTLQMCRCTRPHPETSLEGRLGNIEALLKEAEIVAETARQREYAERTKRLISEAKTNLLDIEARHGNDIETFELDALRASLDYATFNTNMIFIAPYGKKINVYKYELPDLRSRISNFPSPNPKPTPRACVR